MTLSLTGAKLSRSRLPRATARTVVGDVVEFCRRPRQKKSDLWLETILVKKTPAAVVMKTTELTVPACQFRRLRDLPVHKCCVLDSF